MIVKVRSIWIFQSSTFTILGALQPALDYNVSTSLLQVVLQLTHPHEVHTPLPIVGLLEVFIRRPRVAHHHAQSACKRHLFAHGLPLSDGRADSEAAVERPSQVIVVLARQDVHVYVSTTTVQLKDLLDVVALLR